MANFRDCDSSQGVFISVIPSEQILPGSFDETVKLLIDHVLDLSDFESDYNNDHGGAPAYPPSALLKIILASYYRGITGSRKIENLCRHHTVLMALSGFLTPDHSTLAAFVSKHPERLEKLFTEIVLECDYLGLIGGNAFALDGSKISSNASKEWSGTKADFKRKYDKIQKAIKYMLGRHKEEDEQGDIDIDLREKEKKQIKKLRAVAKKLEKPIKEMEDKIGSKGQPKKRNLTDEDSASLMSGGGGATQGYQVLAGVDAKHQVICSADIVESSEQKSFQPMVEQLKENCPDQFGGSHLLADAGFHSIDNIDYCLEHDIDAYIADNKFRKRDPRFRDHDDKKPVTRKRQYYRAEDFIYNEAHNTCHCPAGKAMWLAADDIMLEGQHYRRFVGHLNDCRDCPLQNKCMRHPPKKMGRQVSIKKGITHNDPRPVDLMKEKIDSDKGRSIYSDRMGIIEPVFAHIKHTLGLDWLSLRGRKKVKGQWLLFCMIHNMVKIQKYGEYEPI